VQKVILQPAIIIQKKYNFLCVWQRVKNLASSKIRTKTDKGTERKLKAEELLTLTHKESFFSNSFELVT
jgi:hypothetical protein